MKVAVIGVWHVHAKEYAETIKKNPNAELACVWDKDPETGRKFAEMVGVPFVENIDTIWNDSSIDSISVTTSTVDHPEILIAAAKAGKNIFTEKVLTLTNDDAKTVADAIRESGKVFTISYPHKRTPFMQAAKKINDSGALGIVTYARMRNVHNGSSADWLPPHFYDPNQTGGGAMIDLGAHPMYLLNWLLGEPKSIVSMFTEVTGHGVEDNAVSVIEFSGGAIGVSETGFVSAGNPLYLEISGTEGSLVIREGKVFYSSKKETDGEMVEVTDLPDELPLPVDQWIASVTEGAPVRYNLDEAVSLTNFMVGAYKAYETGTKYNF